MRASLKGSPSPQLVYCRNIPQSLLLLSRAFKITPAATKDKTRERDKARNKSEATLEALRNTFNMLPDETIADVEMDKFKSTASLEKRLEYLQRVEQDIKDENASEADLAAARAELEVHFPKLIKKKTPTHRVQRLFVHCSSSFLLRVGLLLREQCSLSRVVLLRSWCAVS